MEKTVKNPVVISDMKKRLGDIQMAISWREFANTYFKRSSSWLYHKLDGIDGNGGEGGSLTVNPGESYADWEGGDLAGVNGANGSAGTSADEMGTLYIQSTITQQISGGAAGSGGAPGGYGKCVYTGGELEFQGKLSDTTKKIFRIMRIY